MPPFSRSRSLWLDTTFDTNYPQLSGLLEVDAIVIGGGVTGLTTSLLLKQAGLRVALCEKERIANNLTTGHITEAYDIPFHEIVTSKGIDTARALFEAGRESMNTINELIERHRISCSFQWVPGFAFAEDATGTRALEREAETLRQLDIPSHLRREAPLPFAIRAAIEYPNQAQLHPRRYLLALAEALSGAGSYVFERTRVARVAPGEARTEAAHIRARHIIVTSAETEFENLFGPERPTALRKGLIAARTFEDTPLPGLFWDFTHRLRTQNVGGSALLLVSNEDRPESQAWVSRAFDALEDYARSHFSVESIDYRWTTRFWQSPGGLPIVRSLHGIHVASGYGDHDLALGTAAAREIAGDILEFEDRSSLPLRRPRPNVG